VNKYRKREHGRRMRGSRSHPNECRRPVTRVEHRGGGLRERESDTRPYAERILPVTTKLERFTLMAREQLRERLQIKVYLLTSQGVCRTNATVNKDSESRAATSGGWPVEMWTRPADRPEFCGPYGQPRDRAEQ
jgi:hypothetical protein